MKKKLVKLTESDLHNIIKECANNILKEGTIDNNIVNMWDQAEEIMGADAMLHALYNYLNTDIIEDFVETLRREYEIPFEMY